MKLKLFFLSICLPLIGFGQKAQIDLPITWNDTANVDYTVSDFGGNASMLAADPANSSNIVLESTKSNTAQTWAGTTLSTGTGLATAVPFAAGNTVVKALVYSPDANTPIRLKVEDAANPAISVETEVLTTVAAGWDTLTFDFANHVTGTAAINFANTYDKMSIFYNFGTDGATAGAKTYYLDDVFFASSSAVVKAQIDLPITWDDTTNVDYTVSDFGGNASMLAADPANSSNIVLESTKSNTAQTWAGTTLSTGAGLATAVPFAAGNTVVKALVYSPDANTPIRLKVEDAANPAISVETEVLTTVAAGWDTLTFDFANHVTGTAAINFANTYDKMSIFYNFGTDGATAGAKTYYLDDVFFGSGITVPAKAQIDLPISWDDTSNVDYTVTDFGGNASMLVADPANPNNLVMESTKTASAQTWAGTTLSTPSGLATPIPFVQGSTIITVLVWSPDAGTPVRLKVEDATDPTISVETEVQTTVANAWDTLTFDFANQATGTAAINFASTYDKMSIFYNFGTDGVTAGAKTYYCDDVVFGASLPTLSQIDLPITWEGTTVDYTVTDFGGNASAVVVDPTDPNNMVLESIKTGTAELWAGTTLGTPAGLANAIPFAQGSTTMSVDVWSPDAGTPIRLKVEDALDPTISVETEVQTTMTGAWETLIFDFSNEVSGTAAINFSNTYNKASIFYNFGTTGSAAGAKTYYCDNIIFGSNIGLTKKEMASVSIAPNPSNGNFTILGDISGKVNIHVINSNGQVVFHKSMVSNGLNETLQLDLANGIYLVKLSAEGTSVTERILIRK